MKPIRSLLAVTAAATLFGLPTLSNASLVFDLNVDHCTGGCGDAGTSFGTVTLTDVDADTVYVDVELKPELVSMFVATGAGYSLTWVGLANETVDNLSTGFTFLGSGSYSVGSFGTFNYAIDCLPGGGACGNGASNSTTSSLMFDVTHAPTLTLTDFAATNPEGYYFTVDLIGPSGRTGVVGANTSTNQPDCTPGTPECTPSVPEPATLALLGVALAGAASARRRIKPLR